MIIIHSYNLQLKLRLYITSSINGKRNGATWNCRHVSETLALKLDVFRPHIATAHSQLNTQTCLDH